MGLVGVFLFDMLLFVGLVVMLLDTCFVVCWAVYYFGFALFGCYLTILLWLFCYLICVWFDDGLYCFFLAWVCGSL